MSLACLPKPDLLLSSKSQINGHFFSLSHEDIGRYVYLMGSYEEPFQRLQCRTFVVNLLLRDY